jgi:hypothetical protein
MAWVRRFQAFAFRSAKFRPLTRDQRLLANAFAERGEGKGKGKGRGKGRVRGRGRGRGRGRTCRQLERSM